MSKKKIEEPDVREDGLCFVCGSERPEVAVKHEDPFCSSACCREYYELDREGNPA